MNEAHADGGRVTAVSRFTDVTFITAALSVGGGVVGAFCAATAVAVIAAIEGDAGSLSSAATLRLTGFAAGAGALTGAVGAPALAWALLRRVPLGRAVQVTAVGTVIGAVVGEVLNPLNPYARMIPGVIGGALLGFVGAGVGLRIAIGREARGSVARVG